MNAERWREVEAVLQEALDCPPGERNAFLDSRCGDDEAMRREVDLLLGYEKTAESNITGVVREAAAQSMAETFEGIESPERIGPYRVIREIGRGGMGTVYLTEREGEFKKQAAIKLVTRGMDTSALLLRFRNERQILARLEHPYIARLLDGGSTEDGRPYLVMEYVDGAPITAWNKEKGLTARQTIELFRKVCAAVQYAHQNLVVHRDLKPGNILVDTEGSPKLLDFGIAKLLEPDGEYQTMAMTGVPGMMTPDYASPEQVRGEVLTTATDVYSLGAILYELLTETRAHRIAAYTPSEIERAICEQEPLRPSTAAPALKRDDLDNILLMALSKDPQRRYVTAAEFSDDLGRYLDGQTVRAREATFGYRASRYLRRNRLPVAAAGLLAASITVGVVMTVIQARRAERRFRDVRGIAHAVLYDVYDTVHDLPGSTKAREALIKTSLDYLERLRREASNDPEMLTDLAEGYLRVASVQGNVAGRSLGKMAEAQANAAIGISIAEDLARRQLETPARALTRIKLYEMQGNLFTYGGKTEPGNAAYEKAVSAGEDLLKREPDNREYLTTLAKIYRSTAHDPNDSARGLKATRRAMELSQRLVDLSPNDIDAQWQLGQSYGRLGYILMQRLEMPEAVASKRKCVEIAEKVVAAQPGNAGRRQQLSVAYFNYADLLGNPTTHNIGDPSGALQAYKKSLAISLDQAREDPGDSESATSVGIAYARIANVTRDSKEALRLLKQSREILESWVRKDPKNVGVKRHYLYTMLRLASRQSENNDRFGALRTYRDGVALAEPMVAADPTDLTSKRLMIDLYRYSAELLAEANDRSAIVLGGKAVKLAEQYGEQDATNQASRARAARAYAVQGQLYEALAKRSDSEEDRKQAWGWFQKSVGRWQAIQSQSPLSGILVDDFEKAKAGEKRTRLK